MGRLYNCGHLYLRSSGHRIRIVRIAKRHRRGSIRRTFVWGLIFVIDHALEHVFVFNEVSAASISVLHFVLILLGAYVLSRATVKLRQASDSEDAGPDGVFAIHFARLLTQVGRFIIYGAPVLGAVGYVTAAYSLLTLARVRYCDSTRRSCRSVCPRDRA